MRACAGIGRLWRDRRASIAVEFAIIFPILVMITLGSAELCMMMMVDASLEIGISEASRSGSLSLFGTEAQRRDRVKNIVNGIVGRWVSGDSDINITTFVYPTGLTGINTPTWIDGNGNNTCDAGEGTCPPQGIKLVPGIGTQGALVVYTVTVSCKSFTGIFSMLGLDNYTFSRQAVVLNE